MKPFSYETSFRYTDGRQGDIVRARVEYRQLGEQAPYFSITGEVYGTERVHGEKKIAFNDRARWMHSCGCQHRLIARVFPELMPFIKWHLSAADGPMHYVANAVYRAQGAAGIALYQSCGDTRERSTKDFCATTIFGAVNGDVMPACFAYEPPNAPPRDYRFAWEAYAATRRTAIETEITVWCEARLPALREAFMRSLVAVRALEGKL